MSGQDARITARGLGSPRNGFPAGKPYVYRGTKQDTGSERLVTGKMRASNKGKMSRRNERLAAFKDLRDGGRSVEEAAAVLGVHPSTGWRYELETRDGGGDAA